MPTASLHHLCFPPSASGSGCPRILPCHGRLPSLPPRPALVALLDSHAGEIRSWRKKTSNLMHHILSPSWSMELLLNLRSLSLPAALFSVTLNSIKQVQL